MYRPLQTKKPKNKLRIAFFCFAFFILISFTVFPGILKWFSSTANDTAVPAWNTGASTRNFSSNFSLFLNSQSSLVAKNSELSEEIKKLKQQLTGYDFVVQENLELKKTLFQKQEDGVFGAVISRPNITAYDTFLVDIGERSGIQKGDRILTENNTVIGTVEEVYSHSVKAALFSTAGRSSDVLLGPDNVSVQMKGMGGGSFTVELPRDIDVREGDIAILPGAPEYIIAQVIFVEKKSTDAFQKIYLRGAVNIFDVKYVEIVKHTSL